MNEPDDNKKALIRFYPGEFADKDLEKEYEEYEFKNAVKYIKPVLLFSGLLYFSFIIPDFFLIKNMFVYRFILLNRFAFLTLVFLFMLRVKQIKTYLTYLKWVNVYEVILPLFFFSILMLYETPDFLIQTFGLIIIILGIFLVPNKLINMILISVFSSLVFFVISFFKFRSIPFNEFSAAVVYVLLIIAISIVSTCRTNYYKRKQYLNQMKLMNLSVTDNLTGIYNRMKFNGELEKEINISRRYRTEFSLILFDFDDFKTVNDKYGHLMGDNLLIEAVRLVNNSIRVSDTFARWGGEEFVILLPHTGLDRAMELAERLKVKICEHSFEQIGKITCSFGVTSYREGDNIETIMQRVDNLLYAAKLKGKNCIVGG
ncbi:MAG TPA: GGDEF domain-containing protein [Clostridiaceae bacterium]|nr:GGDEF domain-containing protein [Clostridiaceae bacterium]